MLGYSFIVEYKKGKENKAADALSRKQEGSKVQPVDAFVQSSKDVGSLFLISFPCPTWVTILKDSYHEDVEYQLLLTSLSSSPSNSFNFSL